MELRVDSDCGQDTCVIHVEGEIDVSNADALREKLDAVFDKGNHNIEVNLSDAPYIDSTGIGVLMGAANRAHENDINLWVTCPHQNVRRVFNMLGVENLLDIRE